VQAPVPWNSRLFSSCDELQSVREDAEPVTKAGFAPPGADGRTFYQLFITSTDRIPAGQARGFSHNLLTDGSLWQHARGAEHHPDNVVKTTCSGPPGAAECR
jgi:hypothetical protein